MEELKVKPNLDNYTTFEINNPGGKKFKLCISKEVSEGPFFGSVINIVSEDGSEERPFYKRERKTHPSFLRGWDVSD